MVPAGPREIVRKIVHRRYSVESSNRRRPNGRKHKAEADGVVCGITLLAECFARDTVAEIVHESFIDGPRVTSNKPPRMFPEIWRRRVGKLWYTACQIVDNICPQKEYLLTVHVEIKTS